MAVTHALIAEKLGISRTTVTKALKKHETIRAETIKKVFETATLLGYDFKRSQQNRREGKRFYAAEDIDFDLFDVDGVKIINRGNARLTNLSSSGLLFKIEKLEVEQFPACSFVIHMRLLQPIQDGFTLPPARVMRINFYAGIECAARFEDGLTISDEQLEMLEKRSFDRMDRMGGVRESRKKKA